MDIKIGDLFLDTDGVNDRLGCVVSDAKKVQDGKYRFVIYFSSSVPNVSFLVPELEISHLIQRLDRYMEKD